MNIPDKFQMELLEERRKHELGAFLIERLAEVDLSIREIARRMGINASTVARVFNGKSRPPRSELERYAQALELDSEMRDALFEKGGFDFQRAKSTDHLMGENIYFWYQVLEDASEHFHVKGNLNAAEVYLNKILKHIHEGDDLDASFIRARALLILAWVHQARGDSMYAQTQIRLLQEAEAISAFIRDPILEFETIKAQGIVYGNQRSYKNALKYYKKVLAKFGDKPLHKALAGLHRDVLIALARKENSPSGKELREHLMKGLEMADKAESQSHIWLLEEALARALLTIGELPHAEKQIVQALDILDDPSASPLHQAIVLKTATRVCFALGDISIALSFADQARDIAVENGFNHQLKALEQIMSDNLL